MKRFLLILLLILTAHPALALTLHLNERVVVEGEMVRLGQLATLKGADATLADLQVLRAPAPGRQVRVGVKEIRRAVQLRHPEISRMTFTGASLVTLIGGGQVLHATDIEKLLTRYLQQQKSRLPRAQIRLVDLRVPTETILPRGQLRHQVVSSDSNLLKSRRFNLVFRVDGRVVKNMTVSARLEALAPVVVPQADLQRGAILQPQDLQMVVQDIATLRNPCFEMESLIGKSLKRSVRGGTPLDRQAVSFPPMVKRGQLVSIRLNRGGMLLTAKGEARQKGQKDDLIRVRNLNSSRVILCRIVAPGQVEVEM